MHNAVICAIAKNENIYIAEWVEYYFNLGFDHIYLYDNNASTTEYVGNFIPEKYRGKVTIFNINDDYRYHLQTYYYKEFYANYKKTFNWVAFFDIDEFLDLNNEFKDINEFLAQNKFNNINQIVFKWKLFGDNGYLERDMSIPVHEFFKKPATGLRQIGNCTKVIIKGKNATEELGSHGHHVHFVSGEEEPWQAAFPSGQKISVVTYQIQPSVYKNETIFVNHYMTKTLNEFLKYKWQRGDIWIQKVSYEISYYKAVNTWTSAHEEYFRKWKQSSVE